MGALGCVGFSSWDAQAYLLACAIFPDQGVNLCPLHWQVDSYSLYQQRSLILIHFCICVLEMLSPNLWFLFFTVYSVL